MTSTNPSFSPTSLESVDLLSFDQRGSNSEELQSPSSNLEQIDEQKVQQTEESVEKAAADNNASPSIIYQIDFDVEHVGKNKPQSKRMAMWRYQIKDNEHETKLIWSTHSGKYTISVDGIDVYNNIAKGSVLEYKFKWNDFPSNIKERISSHVSIENIKTHLELQGEFDELTFVINEANHVLMWNYLQCN